MDILIAGPGAIGCLVAAYLSRNGNRVCLLDKDSKRAAHISRNGIQVSGISGVWSARVFATSRTKDALTPELAIICTKSYDTESAVRNIAAVAGKDTPVLTFQNGIGNTEIIAGAVGKEHVLGGSTSLGATLLSVGCVRHAGMGETVIGSMDGKVTPALKRVRDIFNSSGLPAVLSSDLEGLLWSKLIINVGINALTAITHLNNGRIAEIGEVRSVMHAAVQEAVRIAAKKGIHLLYKNPVEKVESVCRATSSNIASMLQDVLKGRRTEIDYINGAIVREGIEVGISTPVNEVLLRIVQTIEQSYGITVDSQAK